MSLVQIFSAPNPLPAGKASIAEGGGAGSGSNIGFVAVSSLTFPILGAVGFGLIKILDVLVPSLAGTINAEIIASIVIFVIVVLGDFALNTEGNNTALKKVVTTLVGAVNATLLLGVYLGIITLTDLAAA